MTQANQRAPVVAIACGGTGGHLFPGIAVAEQLVRRGCAVTLMISPKDVDQEAVKTLLERRSPTRRDLDAHRAGSETGAPMEIVTLPAVGLTRGGKLAFLRGFIQSYRAAKEHFKKNPPEAVLAMGGFTSAPPILAARKFGARTFLHESNTIPGRANSWLSRVVPHAFVGFPQAASRLRAHEVTVTGTPVRSQFQPRDAADCRVKLFGVPPSGGSWRPPEGGTPNATNPVVLVVGGSQGASGINGLVIEALPLLAKRAPTLQWIHLTGPNDADKARRAYAALGLNAVVHPFFAAMELALGAATVAVSRAGASSLAELAAMRVPSVLIPYLSATDNHQFHNGRAFEETGAARLLEQQSATPEKLAGLILELVENTATRQAMQVALAAWHKPQAAEQIAEEILRSAKSCVRATEGKANSSGQECHSTPERQECSVA